eukprot:403334176
MESNQFERLKQMFSQKEQKENHYDVLIIGAGAAGLAAGQYLKKAGINYMVLEARDRIGGRVHAIPFGKDQKLIDLGGQWIHGLGPGAEDIKEWDGKYNPVYQIAMDNKVETVKCWLMEERIQKTFWWKGGEVPHDVWGLLEEVKDYLEEHSENADINESVVSFLSRKFNYESDSDLQKVYEWVLSYWFSQDYGADPNKFSARYQETDPIFNGTEDVIPESMAKILSILAEGQNIKLNQQIAEIDYQGAQIKVTTKEDTVYTTKQVIVCVPLPILKAEDIKFVPSLPEIKQKSIKALGVSQMDKLILEFEEVFWDTDVDWFNHISEIPGDWAQTLNIYKYMKRPILMMFNGEPNTHNFENMSDEEVYECGMKVIRNMFPNATEPISYVRTNWNKEQFSKGTFTYIAAGSSPDDCWEIAKPVDNKLFFAGEYAYPHFIGTVNSAMISGEISAKAVVDHHNQKTMSALSMFYDADHPF